MKSKNKKGFTLVELLAVIVILAVVILIAVTAVVPRMNKARENAFVDEALVYIRAGKEAYISNETKLSPRLSLANFTASMASSTPLSA